MIINKSKSIRHFAITKSLMSLSLAALLVGCGSDGPELAKVKGKVTIDGQSLPNATLTFIPKEGTPSYGMTNATGEYELMFTDTKYGAQLGEHAVSVEVTKMSKGEIEELKAQGIEVIQPKVDLPKQYRKSGALSATVSRGSNNIDFSLESKPAK